jgi:alkaline phosphatase
LLDACFRSDGEPYGRKNFQWTDANIPPTELEWLQADLRSNRHPVIVFAHQRLDVSNNHGVKNNGTVRKILESSGKVLAVFQGHSHQNDLKEINGIPYCTLVAMVEGSGAEKNGYSLLDIQPNGTIHLTGFRKQNSHVWDRK